MCIVVLVDVTGQVHQQWLVDSGIETHAGIDCKPQTLSRGSTHPQQLVGRGVEAPAIDGCKI